MREKLQVGQSSPYYRCPLRHRSSSAIITGLIRAAISGDAINVINVRRASRIVAHIATVRNALTNYASHPRAINHGAWLVARDASRDEERRDRRE